MRRYHKFSLEVLHFLPVLLHGKSWAQGDGPSDFIHAWTRARTIEKLNQYSLLKRILVVGLWPLAALMSSAYVTWASANRVKSGHGRSVVAQVGDQFRLAVGAGIPAPWYYMFDLYKPELRAKAHDYVLRHHTKNRSIYARLKVYSGARRDHTFGDKLLFHDFCRGNSLPTASVFCVVHGDGVDWLDGNSQSLPLRDIFAKPRRSRGGRGAERWEWRNGSYVDSHGLALDAAALLARFQASASQGDYLLQERLVNHGDLSALNAGALSTVRVIVCSDENWQPEIVHAYMRMSCIEGNVVDNVHAGGLASPVDIESGVLGKATDLGGPQQLGWVNAHPLTGAVIEGRRVPNWPEIRDLAIRAHRAVAKYTIVGWDIAILENGACFVEGNAAPCVDSTQRMLSQPIGNERFGELLAYHLARAEAGYAPPQSNTVGAA